MSKTNLEERQRKMAERQKIERTAKRHLNTKVYPKSSEWCRKHFVEVIGRLIDDLGLDVPRREPKLTA